MAITATTAPFIEALDDALPSADSVNNNNMSDVIGNKTDRSFSGNGG